MPDQQGQKSQCLSLQLYVFCKLFVCQPDTKKLLKAKIEGSADGPCALFEPEPELRAELSMPEALVKPDVSCLVTLMRENSSFEPTRLKKGRILGQLYPTSTLSDQEPKPDPTEPLKGDGANPPWSKAKGGKLSLMHTSIC